MNNVWRHCPSGITLKRITHKDTELAWKNSLDGGRWSLSSYSLAAWQKKNKRELSPSALTECISNKHHNNVKGNSRAIFSSIVLSLSRSYYRRFFNNSVKRKFSHGCMVTTWVSRQLTECRPKRSVRLFSILKNGHLTSAYFLTSGNSTL